MLFLFLLDSDATSDWGDCRLITTISFSWVILIFMLKEKTGIPRRLFPNGKSEDARTTHPAVLGASRDH